MSNTEWQGKAYVEWHTCELELTTHKADNDYASCCGKWHSGHTKTLVISKEAWLFWFACID